MILTLVNTPLETFVQSLASRDFDAIEGTFAPDVQFRALVPPGLREAQNPKDARKYIEGWFGDADEFEMVGHAISLVNRDRIHVSYRIHMREGDIDSGVPCVVEQNIFVNTDADGNMEKFDLVCSGPVPRGTT